MASAAQKYEIICNIGGKTQQTYTVKPNSYRLRLMSDEEIKSKSEIIFTYDDIISKNYTLDSANFGCTNLHPECSICGNNIDNCPGHMGAIISPFPFVKAICVESFKTIVEMICPICSHIPLPKLICSYIAKFISDEYKIPYIQKKLLEYKSNTIICPWCKQKVPLFKIVQKEPLIYVGAQIDNNSEPIIINPLAVQAMLQNFNQYNVVGWPESYNVGNFMTCVVPIIPNKLRMKSIDNSVSIITTFYKNIVEEIVPELGKIYKTLQQENLISFPNNSLFQQFQIQYNKLMAYYMLISDATSAKSANRCLDIANKNDRKHFEGGVSCIGRIKDKDNSMFNKGIISTRVDDACRSVLGGAPDSKIMDIHVPNFIANKLTMKFSVFEENLKTIQQIVASMSNTEIWNNIQIPHVLYIEDKYNKFKTKIDPSNAQTKAALLKAGDKIEVSLLDGYFVMHCRFPSIREESWTSQRVKRTNGDIISIPLSICEMKTADFDGDESQIYVNSSTCYQLEALLLHSCARMMSTYKNGSFIIWYDSDADYGIPKIKTNKMSIIKDFKASEPYNVIERLEKLFPKDLNYEDSKTCIKNGKFVDERTNVNNRDLMEYIKDIYGPIITLNIMDEVVKMAYDLNKNDGSTLGYEIVIYDDKVKNNLKSIRNNLYKKLKTIEKTNDPLRHYKLVKECEESKASVHKMLFEQCKGTNLANLGFLPKFLPEYSHVVHQLDFIKDTDGAPFRNLLAENTRTLCTFPKYSIDPCAYGYCKNGFDGDISPTAQFFQCKKERMALFTKSGTAIGKQGYFQKRLSIMHSAIYADFNHAMVDNNKLVSLVYSTCGCDPRKHVKQPIIDINLSKNEFIKKYKQSNNNYKRIIELYDEIHNWMQLWNEKTADITIPVEYKDFVTGFNWTQWIKQNMSKLTKPETNTDLIDELIENIKEDVFPSGARKGIWKDCLQYENFKYHEYFFRIMFGYNYRLTKDTMDDILIFFNSMLCEGGEPLGIKAANSVAEPMSQIILKAIHGNIGGGASDNNVKRMSAFDAFENLLGGKSPKEVVITIGLYDDSYEASKKWAEEQETFYINDIWTRAEINISNEVDKRIVKLYKDELDFTQFAINPMMISINLSVNKIASYGIHITDIFDKLVRSYSSIMFICGYILNSTEFKALIYFENGTSYDQINFILEEWTSIHNQRTLVHGGYLKNCYVIENKNLPGHYYIQANEVEPLNKSLENLIYNPEIDPFKCSSTNIDTCLELFGCCEANSRHILECVYTSKNISATSGVLVSHYKLVSDNSFTVGKFLTATRYSLKDDQENDPLRLVSYETPKDFLMNTIKTNRTYTDNSLVSSTFFGGKGSQFSGDMVSKIILFEK